jgi:hypothetical protein
MICATSQSHAQMMLRKRLAGELRGADAMIPINTAAKVRAQQLAMAKVQDAIKRQGAKWSALTAAEKQGWSNLFLEDHPSLVAQARHEVEAWARGSNKEISVQMSGAK